MKANAVAYYIPRPIDAQRINDKGHQVYFSATGEELAWSGDHSLPAPGELVEITMNGIGLAIVRGYFQEYGFLGVITEPLMAPAWLRDQQRKDTRTYEIPHECGCEFGCEIEPAREPLPADEPNAEQRAALNSWVMIHGRTWRSKLNDAWMDGNYGGFSRPWFLQQLRNQYWHWVKAYQPRTK